MPETARIEVNGEPIELLPERAVWWPGARTLIVSDLHLGKEHAFGALGIAVPGGVLEETLGRLAACTVARRAQRIIIVGDLLHARLGTTPAVVDRVASWRDRLEADFWLVPGNHDRDVASLIKPWRLHLCEPECSVGPFRFAHDPGFARDDGFTWCGHIHPVVRLEGGRDSLRLPCFHITERVGVLPAFSLFTGGSRTEIAPGDTIWAIGPNAVFKTPTPWRVR